MLAPPAVDRQRRRRRRLALRLGFGASLAVAFAGGTGSAQAAAPPAPFAIEVDRQQAIFQLTNLAPGPLGRRCLVLSTRNGAADAAVLSATVGGTGLADHLEIVIDVGTSTDPASCADFVGATAFAGTVAELGALHADPARGVPLPLAGGTSAVVRFSLTLRSDDAAQGRAATLSFRFDAQDTSPPTVPDTTVPDTTVPDTTVPDTTVAEPTIATTTTTSAGTATTVDPVLGGGASRPRDGAGTGGHQSSTAPATTVGRNGGGGPEIVVRDPGAAPEPAGAVARAVALVATTAATAAKTSSVPGLFVSFVVGFLVVQDRFDRNDPKLARAPLAPEPEMAFRPRGPRASS